MREIVLDKGFQKDIQRDKTSGKYTVEDFELLKSLIIDLQQDEPISPHHKRHILKGDLRGL